MKRPVPLATTWVYDTSAYEIVDIVTSITVHSVSLFRQAFANVGGLFGGQVSTLETVFMDARDQAYADISEKASKRRADLVVGLQVEVQEMRNFFIFTATGTMLRKKRA
jgi:uncharacterized protein YbjQ (UPF0145 family)